MRNMMHGCGVKLWRQTYNDSIQALEGKFFADDYMGPVMPCNKDDCFDSAVEADVAASHARSFLVSQHANSRKSMCPVMQPMQYVVCMVCCCQ